MPERGFTLIEILIAITLLSVIACGTSQYFVWMTMKTRDHYFRSVAALNQFSAGQKMIAYKKRDLLTIVWPDNKLNRG